MCARNGHIFEGVLIISDRIIQITLLWLKKVRTPIQPIWDRSHRSLSHPLHFPAGFFDAAAQDVNVAVVYGFMWTRVVNTRYTGMALQAQT